MAEDGLANALQVVVDAATCEESEDVPMTTFIRICFIDRRRRGQEVGLGPEQWEDMGTAIKGNLYPRPRRAGDEEAGKNFFHFIAGAGLRQGLDTKANGVLFPLAKAALIQDKQPGILLPRQVGKNPGEARHLRNFPQ